MLSEARSSATLQRVLVVGLDDEDQKLVTRPNCVDVGERVHLVVADYGPAIAGRVVQLNHRLRFAARPCRVAVRSNDRDHRTRPHGGRPVGRRQRRGGQRPPLVERRVIGGRGRHEASQPRPRPHDDDQFGPRPDANSSIGSGERRRRHRVPLVTCRVVPCAVGEGLMAVGLTAPDDHLCARPDRYVAGPAVHVERATQERVRVAGSKPGSLFRVVRSAVIEPVILLARRPAHLDATPDDQLISGPNRRMPRARRNRRRRDRREPTTIGARRPPAYPARSCLHSSPLQPSRLQPHDSASQTIHRHRRHPG